MGHSMRTLCERTDEANFVDERVWACLGSFPGLSHRCSVNKRKSFSYFLKNKKTQCYGHTHVTLLTFSEHEATKAQRGGSTLWTGQAEVRPWKACRSWFAGVVRRFFSNWATGLSSWPTYPSSWSSTMFPLTAPVQTDPFSSSLVISAPQPFLKFSFFVYGVPFFFLFSCPSLRACWPFTLPLSYHKQNGRTSNCYVTLRSRALYYFRLSIPLSSSLSLASSRPEATTSETRQGPGGGVEGVM